MANDANPAAIAALNASGGRALGFDVPAVCGVTPTGAGSSNGNVPNICTASAAGAVVDGIVSLNTAVTIPPNTQTSPNPIYFDLLSTAEHEIDEILGLGSALQNCDSTSPSGPCQPGATLNAGNDTFFGVGAPEDLFRWNAATGGARTLSTNCTTPTGCVLCLWPVYRSHRSVQQCL